ncbi:phasin family protein [Sphingobium sp. AN641]|uniref:phasin family protein n=1 Tax=Sphingobium sp. AN641 TaxID=3133443 RepID=UPI0030C0F909
MANVIKTGVRKAPIKRAAKPASVGGTLSAGEALKAAEAAIAPPPAKAPRKVAPKASAPEVSVSKPAETVTSAPAAVVAATTSVDAPSEPPMVETQAAVETPVADVATPEETSPPPSVAPAPAPVIEGSMIMNEVMETGKKFAEDAKAKIETVYAGLNEKAKVGVEKSTKALEEMSDLAKGNVEALVESGKIAAKGVETMGQEAVDYSRKSFEKATASFKSFSTIKTPTEFFQLQSHLISSSFDDFAKEAAKNSEALMKLASEVAQPITARVTIVTDKVKTLAA